MPRPASAEEDPNSGHNRSANRAHRGNRAHQNGRGISQKAALPQAVTGSVLPCLRVLELHITGSSADASSIIRGRGTAYFLCFEQLATVQTFFWSVEAQSAKSACSNCTPLCTAVCAIQTRCGFTGTLKQLILTGLPELQHLKVCQKPPRSTPKVLVRCKALKLPHSLRSLDLTINTPCPSFQHLSHALSVLASLPKLDTVGLHGASVFKCIPPLRSTVTR